MITLFSKEKANEIIIGFGDAIDKSFDLYRKNNHIDFTGKTFNEALELVQSVTTSYKNLISSIMYNGYFIPKCIINFEVTHKDNEEDVADSVILTIRKSLKSKMKFVQKVKISIEDYVDKSAFEIKKACFYMTLLDMADNNITALNETLGNICDKAGSGVSFGFALSNNYIADIDDNTVTFGTSIETALDISTLTIMKIVDDDFFRDYIIEEEKKKIASAVKDKTTPQIVKTKLDIIETMTGIQTKRAYNLIKDKYYICFDILNESGVGYIYKKVNINGTEVDIFALLEKSADGVVSVKLSPFNVKTNLNVNYDILNNL